MTVKISVFAVVLIVTYVSAEMIQPSALALHLPYMPYYPKERTTFTEFKKSVYTLNQALFNVIASARSAYNYYSLYNKQPGLTLEITEKKDKFEKALNYFENKLMDYRHSLIQFKTLINYDTNIPVTSLDDDIPIDRAIL
ncbi:uncharacterized protein LOC111033419 [Myzus persicae]|uniref:Mp1 effector n=1 Tax=Myzus persicae TaxID=13164 RepID=A0A1S6EKL2_MYZPE|nr:uncharacterized protein LOC111033419 [Myzus persicae]AQR58533.1 Mp1 effector [Myzus persicae]